MGPFLGVLCVWINGIVCLAQVNMTCALGVSLAIPKHLLPLCLDKATD